MRTADPPAVVSGSTPAEETAPSDSEGDLALLCQAAGWEGAVRGGGQLAITLDVPRSYCVARAMERSDGSLHLWLELEGGGAAELVSKAAVGQLLLTASRRVRLVRAVAIPSPNGTQYRWEVVWADRPTSGQLNHALAGLSLAGRLTVREVAALADPAIAKHFLDVCGVSA